MPTWLRTGLVVGLLSCAPGAHALTVGSAGQASYGLPLSVPPGVSGMSPNLALSYADGGINGPVGVGWSVQGISSITRCPSSKVIDGTLRNGVRVLPDRSRPTVRFDQHDRLCLDGQRLIVTDVDGKPALDAATDASGLPGGTPYREFRTEKDSFARIRAYGEAVAGNADAGPAHFKVWTKSGQVYEYGTSPSAAANARISAQGTDRVAVWAVSRISDTVGNYIDFRYEVRSLNWGSGSTLAGAPGQEWNLKEVLYTGNATSNPVLTPQNKVVFVYDDRGDTPDDTQPADRSEAYQKGSKNLSISRLSAVRTYVNAASTPILVRSWALDYEISPRTGRSRLSRVRECIDEAHTRCLPATAFTYSDGAELVYAVSADLSPPELALALLTSNDGSLGTLTGDFNGDGKTDLLVWNNNPSSNSIHFSAGNGRFAKQTAFNLTGGADRIFSQDGCYSTTVMDLNGDGMSDLLRTVKPSCNTGQPSKVFISNGNGSFLESSVNDSIDFREETSKMRIFSLTECPLPQRRLPRADGRPRPATDAQLAHLRTAARSARDTNATKGAGNKEGIPLPGYCELITYSDGKRYYMVDVNGDGLADIVNSAFPQYSWYSSWGDLPDNRYRCSMPWLFDQFGSGEAMVCTRVFLAQGDGTFVEDRPGTHPNQHETLYVDPPTAPLGTNPYWRPVNEADFDGDGLVDLTTHHSGWWRNRGDGSFEPGTETEAGANCTLAIDFNGDQRSDCLRPSQTPAEQFISVTASNSTTNVARFNLTRPGDELYTTDDQGRQTTGPIIEDLDGDGRQDILRWSSDTGRNGIYFSNGNGSFRGPMGAGLNTLTRPLMTTDGKNNFISGDFLGDGSLQLLHFGRLGSGIWSVLPLNTLLHLQGDRTPVDHLVTVRTGSGVEYRVNQREPITTSAAYTSERSIPESDPPPDPDPPPGGPIPRAETKPVQVRQSSLHLANLAATGQLVDIQPPTYVIVSTSKTSPGFAAVKTLHSYRGLKAERNGRGLLGFRETRQQTKAPNGHDMTIVTSNLQVHPYIGVAGVTETFIAPPSGTARRISRTTYSYCDKTSAAAPNPIVAGGTAPAPCATEDKVQRPFLYESLEEGWDLGNPNLPLPSVRTRNSFNSWGDPTLITVETRGTGPAGMETFTKTVTNEYQPPMTDGERWILGRLQKASVRQTAPYSLDSLSTAKGNNPRADQRDGNGPLPTDQPPPPINPAVLSAIITTLLND